MKRIAPDYYGEFRCIAGACRHSCCIGWEIDIDDETLEKYRAVKGEFGKRLADGIEYTDEQACFRLCEGERCPFLNGEGLCDIILHLGEDALSQICTDHPRFRNFFFDREEIGLGLCCEAAGKLILGRDDKTELVVLEDDGEEEAPDAFEADILEIRERLMGIAQDRSMTVDLRMSRILEAVDLELPDVSFDRWMDFYSGLEQLDPAWGKMLADVRDLPIPEIECEETIREQLLVYFLFRNVAGAADEGDLAARAAFAVHAVNLICTIAQLGFGSCSLDAMAEVARMYSAEIEYSDENLQAILDVLSC